MKKIITFITLAILSISCLVLVGCGNSNSANSTTSSQYTIKDDTGRTLTFEHPPEKIVSLTYGTDEILWELVGPKRITALSRWAGDPQLSFLTPEQVKEVGKKADYNAEYIFSLQPDLVVVSTATPAALVKTLEDLKLKVYISKTPKNYDEMVQKVTDLAAAVHEEAKGKNMVDKMNQQLNNLESKLKSIPPNEEKTVVAFSNTGPMGRKGNLFDDMLTKAHLKNGITATSANQTVSKEEVININPDVILLPTWGNNGKYDPQKFSDTIIKDPAYRNVKAIKNNAYYHVNDKYRYVASQHIVDGIEALAKTVYPQIFSTK